MHMDHMGRLTEDQTPSLKLTSSLDEYSANSKFNSTEQHDDHDMINVLKQITEQVAARVDEPHKVQNILMGAMMNPDLAAEVCGVVDHECNELKSVLDVDQIGEGFEILANVEALQEKHALATRRTQVLELSLSDLTEKIKLLESKIELQDRQILDAQKRQEEQDALLLSPMRSIYLHHFHDQVREGICEKLSSTPLHARHQRALRLRVYEEVTDHRYGDDLIFDDNLWSFMQETHGISPQFFDKTTMWNEFVDELLTDAELMASLGLSPASILVTRFGKPDGHQDQPPEAADSAAAASVRRKHIFAELVSRQDEEQWPTYTELYKFLFNAEPETLSFKAIDSSDQEVAVE